MKDVIEKEEIEGCYMVINNENLSNRQRYNKPKANEIACIFGGQDG